MCTCIHTCWHDGRTTEKDDSFIQSGYFYSAYSSPLLLRSTPDTARLLCRKFTPKRHRQLRVKDLPMVPMWRLDLDSNLRTKGVGSTNERPCPSNGNHWCLRNNITNININQSIKIYIVPFQDQFSEVLSTQTKWKRTVLRKWWIWEQAPFGRCLSAIGTPFQVVESTTEKEHVCIIAERANGTTKLPWAEDRSVQRPM